MGAVCAKALAKEDQEEVRTQRRPEWKLSNEAKTMSEGWEGRG